MKDRTTLLFGLGEFTVMATYTAEKATAAERPGSRPARGVGHAHPVRAGER